MNVDCRCDGAEMSIRDQREGTSLSDWVKEDVSLEYFTLSITNNIYHGYNMRRETVAEYLKRGGKVENLPYVKNYSIDYFSFGKVKPKNGTKLDLRELIS